MRNDSNGTSDGWLHITITLGPGLVKRVLSVTAILRQVSGSACGTYFTRWTDSFGLGAAACEGCCEAALEGQISILEAVRELVREHTRTRLAMRRIGGSLSASRAKLTTYLSEKFARFGHPKLREKDVEIANAEASWKGKFLEACKRIAEGDADRWPTRSPPQ